MQSASKPQGDRRPKVIISGNKNTLNDYIWNQTNGIVQSGPFTGMKLVKDHVWDDGNLGNKCIGCYEQELHDPIENEIELLSKLDSPQIVNIGSAEGFYAIGLARRLPKATIFVVDIDEKSIALAMQAATLNNVKLHNEDIDTAMLAPDLVVSDCEGAEILYLDLDKYPALRNSTIIVETHDFTTQHTTEVLGQRFKHTHLMSWSLTETMRAPNNYDCLISLPSHAKWMAVSEGRPSTQHFLYMKPK